MVASYVRERERIFLRWLENVERLLDRPVDRDAAYKAWGDGYSVREYAGEVAVPPFWPRTDAAHHTPDRAGIAGLQHLQDWTMLDDGREVGRIYEDGSISTPAELRWFWSVSLYVPPAAGIVTSGKVPTLDEAKTQFETAWQHWRRGRR